MIEDVNNPNSTRFINPSLSNSNTSVESLEYFLNTFPFINCHNAYSGVFYRGFRQLLSAIKFQLSIDQMRRNYCWFVGWSVRQEAWTVMV